MRQKTTLAWQSIEPDNNNTSDLDVHVQVEGVLAGYFGWSVYRPWGCFFPFRRRTNAGRSVHQPRFAKTCFGSFWPAYVTGLNPCLWG